MTLENKASIDMEKMLERMEILEKRVERMETLEKRVLELEAMVARNKEPDTNKEKELKDESIKDWSAELEELVPKADMEKGDEKVKESSEEKADTETKYDGEHVAAMEGKDSEKEKEKKSVKAVFGATDIR